MNRINKKSIFFLFYFGTVGIEMKIRRYKKLLNSDKHFTREDYRYFGEKIYELRSLRKKMAEEMAFRTLTFLKKLK